MCCSLTQMFRTLVTLLRVYSGSRTQRCAAAAPHRCTTPSPLLARRQLALRWTTLHLLAARGCSEAARCSAASSSGRRTWCSVSFVRSSTPRAGGQQASSLSHVWRCAALLRLAACAAFLLCKLFLNVVCMCSPLRVATIRGRTLNYVSCHQVTVYICDTSGGHDVRLCAGQSVRAIRERHQPRQFSQQRRRQRPRPICEQHG